MSHNFSQIKSILSSPGNSSQHRNVFILAGQRVWQKNSLKEILSDYKNEPLWVGEESVKDFSFVEHAKIRAWLGKEKRVVIFDANNDFNPDSFAAISGIIVGGGLFFLLLPEAANWDKVYSSPFGNRLIQSIHQHADLVVIDQNNAEFDVVSNTVTASSDLKYGAPFLTQDQQQAVESIEQELDKNLGVPIVLVSDRGRGKSAALGLTIARLLKSGVTNIAVTAPRLLATDIIFKHIEGTLLHAVVTRGCVKYGDAEVKFYSPDHLIQENIKADILFVDEAAAIPVPALSSFLTLYPQCVFATTVHGYEGTGRGFSLRFYSELDKKYEGWLKLQMQTPIRWAENDPLEKWMFDLLCLDAEVSDINKMEDFDHHDVEHQLLNKNELADNKRLKEIFSLLVIAHYRTRPKDLKNLLDDDGISVYISIYHNHIVAVALVINEGSFSEELSTEVYQGKRRPLGNLLAQTLTYHCGIEKAATLDYARIMRVAVHPELQHKGIGTGLIKFIVRTEKIRGRDAIGTSFGLNLELLNFWRKLKFDVVRIGFTREQTSGEHAAIMLQEMSSKGQEIKKIARIQFNNKLKLWFDDVLKDITPVLKNEFDFNENKELTLSSFDKKDLNSFIHYSRSYELCISAINKYVAIRLSEINSDVLPDDFRHILNMKLVEKLNWKKVGTRLGLTGKTQAREFFRKAVSFLFELNIEKL